MSSLPELQPLVAGQRLARDWFDAAIPPNIAVGEGTRIDSSHSFYFFESTRPQALRTGRNVVLWRSSLAIGPNASVVIGDDCYVCNASLVCEEGISLGDRVMVSFGVTIADCDFHPTAPAERILDTIALAPNGDRATRPAITPRPVWIGSDVWLGANATVLKGVTIGDGAFVAPGTMVVNDIPPGSVVEGNPGRIVRTL